MSLKSKIRTIADYPKPGIQFRDITTLLLDAEGFAQAVDGLVEMAQSWASQGRRIDKVAGIEARGFVLGGAVAHQLGAGFVPVRKAGKLPAATMGQDYQLEYGSDRLEIHQDAFHANERILIIDDLLATGGTALAALQLIERTGAIVLGAAFVIDLPELGGCEKLVAAGIQVKSLVQFAGG